MSSKNLASGLRPAFRTACATRWNRRRSFWARRSISSSCKRRIMEAQRVIERESVIRLSQKDAHKVLALLDNPPKPNKRLKDAVKAFKGTVRA